MTYNFYNRKLYWTGDNKHVIPKISSSSLGRDRYKIILWCKKGVYRTWSPIIDGSAPATEVVTKKKKKSVGNGTTIPSCRSFAHLAFPNHLRFFSFLVFLFRVENLGLHGIVHRTSNQRICTADLPKTNSNILILGCMEEGLSFPHPK